MTLYFDTKVQFLDSDAISTIGVWHQNESIFAVASYSQNRGGSVTIFDDLGEPLRDISFPVHPTSQAIALVWHPEKRLLASGWENGEVHVWYNGNREFSSIPGPHKSPIMLLAFSEQGGRMISADSAGCLTGWRCDNNGHFLTMFTHDLRDALLHITFRKTVQSSVSSEISNLAKAAVNGDELALDTLTNWRPRTAARNLSHSGISDNHCFYVGTESGIVYYLNQSGSCTEVFRSDNAPISQILWHPKREAIVTLMEDMTVGHYLVESTGSLTELDRVKLSSMVAGHNGAISWAGNALAIITGDLTVRIWDIDTSDNYLLSMDLPNLINLQKTTKTLNNPADGDHIGIGSKTIEVFTCIAYNSDNQTLCAGTNQGNLYTWKRTNYLIDVPENLWQLNNISTVKGAIKHCIWGLTDSIKFCIMVNCISSVFILKEQPLMSGHSRNVWASQKTASQVFIENSDGNCGNVQMEISITDLCLNDVNLIMTNGRTVIVNKIVVMDDDIKNKTLNIKTLNCFTTECLKILLYEQCIVALGQNDIKILSLGGVTLQELQVTEMEGKPIGMDLTNNFLTIFTINGYIKIYDISRHEPKLITGTKNGHDLFDNFGEIIFAKCNSLGTHLAVTIANENLIPDGKFYVWDFERDVVGVYDFLGLHGRIPITFFWDTDDSRLLACEVRSIQKSIKSPSHSISTTTNSSNLCESLIKIMFIKESDINELETINLNSGQQLINLCAPHAITLKISVIERIALRDFKGLEKCDLSTRKMVLDFSLNVAQGNMDHAFRCIRSLQSEAVWFNLAKMCVQTGRLDVAKVCLGHLKRARSVRALRKAIDDESLELDAKVAVLAIELGMIDEAENLYKKCGRFDLLNRLLQACGKFDEALQIAEQCDRVHLKNTHFKYAEWLRENGDVQGALSFFDKSHDSTQHITQMLMDDPIALRQYMQSTTEPKLLNWYAQFIESTGDMDGAFKIYQKSEDWFSQVRILCFLGQLSKADAIARQSNDPAACYHLARHYENIGKIQDSIQFYTKAQTFGNAVRICKENDLHDELWQVASSGRSQDKASAASFFEDSGDYKRAVELYYRAGMLHKAVEMAFASQQPETLQVIASEFDVNSDPELVLRCAEFFVSIEQSMKAVQLLANARQLQKALEICAEKGVPITESLAELLTPLKDELENGIRIKILIQLGEILQQQGDYHSATKKFTQAGDKSRAMKSLLKSGDTDKIIFYTGMSRQKEVYIMAANYLQALNWQSDPKILKNIVTFYSKGQAYDLLANFYATCAQVEIDDFRDYEKALKAMQEAGRCLGKVPNSQGVLDKIQMSVLDIKKVIELQESMERGENQAVISGCRNLLANNERPPIRQIDVLALLLEALVASKNYTDALSCLRELAIKAPDWSLKGLVERPVIEKLARESHIDFESLWKSGRKRINIEDETTQSDYEEEIQEEVEM